MMKIILLISFIVGCLGNGIQNNTKTQFPLCTICKCQMRTTAGTELADVVCSSVVHHDIFSPDFWQTQIDNKTHSYNYHSFNIQNNVFSNLSEAFPSSNLVYLNLANNNIVSITQSVFKNLQNLEVLILSYNDLDDIDPDAFRGLYTPQRFMPLKKLRELKLDHNKLHTLNQNIFEHTSLIEILDLSYNPFKIIDHHTLVAIVSLTYLKELYLQYTEIKTLPDTMLHTPKYIQILDISGNPISQMPKTLGEAHNLTNLYMNNTGFTNLTDQNVFPDMPTVRTLHLCRNEYLYRLGKHSLSGLTNLEDLRLCDNIDLTEIDPMALAKPTSEAGGNIWPKIRKLHLGNNKLSHLDSSIIARWEDLTELDIEGNPWMCECESQWLIDELYPIYLKINATNAADVRCAAPLGMVRYSFQDLYEKKSHMRCLDLNDAHPENDALMLVGILAGVLIALPLITILIIGYQRKWFNLFGMCDSSPAAYSRRFYSTSPTEEI